MAVTKVEVAKVWTQVAPDATLVTLAQVRPRTKGGLAVSVEFLVASSLPAESEDGFILYEGETWLQVVLAAMGAGILYGRGLPGPTDVVYAT